MRRRISTADMMRRIEVLERELAGLPADRPLADHDIDPETTYYVDIPDEAERKPARVVARLLAEEWRDGAWVRSSNVYRLERTDLQKKAQGPAITRKAEKIYRSPK